MPRLIVPFGQLLPDQPEFANPGLLRVTNAIPRVNSYAPFPNLTTISNALAEAAIGAVSANDTSGNTYVYAGTTSKLYEMVAYSFTDESKGGGYSTASDDVWEFVVWEENQKVIATNYTNPVQSIAIGGGAGGAFADLFTSTNKPKAKHIGIVGRFLVLGYTNDTSDGERASRVWWSGIGDETDMDPAASTQSDYEDLASGGQVQKIVGGTEYGLIFQSEIVRTMRYIGGSTIFELLPINYVQGTPIPQSVIPYYGRVFYISEQGFMALNGVSPEPIGNARIDREFWREFDPSNKRSMSTAVDPVNKIVAWAYPTTGLLPDTLLMCKYDEMKWAKAEIDTEYLVTTETQGYTLDGLDTVGTDIDNAGVFDESFDSDKWKGGAFRFGAIDQNHTLGFFTGSNLKATFETGDIQPVQGRRWEIGGVRPLANGSGARVTAATRTRLADPVVYGNSSTMNIDGECKMRSEGRYQRLRVSLSGSFSHIQGLEIDYTLTGER